MSKKELTGLELIKSIIAEQKKVMEERAEEKKKELEVKKKQAEEDRAFQAKMVEARKLAVGKVIEVQKDIAEREVLVGQVKEQYEKQLRLLNDAKELLGELTGVSVVKTVVTTRGGTALEGLRDFAQQAGVGGFNQAEFREAGYTKGGNVGVVIGIAKGQGWLQQVEGSKPLRYVYVG